MKDEHDNLLTGKLGEVIKMESDYCQDEQHIYCETIGCECECHND